MRPDNCPRQRPCVRGFGYACDMAPKQLVGVMLTSLTLLSTQGCGSKDDDGGIFDSAGGSKGTAGSLMLEPLGGSNSSGGSSGGPGPAPGTLPDGFAKVDVGGYKLGDPITSETGSGSAGGPATNGDGCGTVILAVIRDFKSDHPDFEKTVGAELGLVKPALGADRKPVFAHDGATATVSGPDSFNQWYSNVDGVNQPFTLQVFFAPKNGTTSFQSNAFFPLDGKGFGDESNNHNFHFTTEIHTQFRYNGGEVFNFTGDDDVWIFINGKLLVDLGGVHAAESAMVDMDAKATEVGISKGQVYPFDMFQAERHTSESNFRADTNLEFVDCGTIVPDVPK
jgi:fibro-slime domain-containing protein